MHGIIHLELRKFVETTFGPPAWDLLRERTGLADEIYTPLASYPDEHIVALVTAASEMTKKSAGALLEAFGEFLVPTYFSLYGKFLDPAWKTLDVIEHTEGTIHRVVRIRLPNALPPLLEVERTSPTEVVISYASQRRLCAVARGICRGMARRFGETIRLHDRRCMLRGDPTCEITVRQA